MLPNPEGNGLDGGWERKKETTVKENHPHISWALTLDKMDLGSNPSSHFLFCALEQVT